jgi:hypothetical protein
VELSRVPRPVQKGFESPVFAMPEVANATIDVMMHCCISLNPTKREMLPNCWLAG